MADSRQDTVEANIEEVEAKYGTEGWYQIIVQLLKDIDISLAMLADK